VFWAGSGPGPRRRHPPNNARARAPRPSPKIPGGGGGPRPPPGGGGGGGFGGGAGAGTATAAPAKQPAHPPPRPHLVPAGPDARLEHEVERVRPGQGVAGLGGEDLVAVERVAEAVGRQLFHRRQQLARLFPLVGGQRGFGVGQGGFQRGLQEVVGAVAVPSDRVGHHQVREPVHVPRRLEHDLRRDGGALELEHALFEHKVLAPQRRHVLFDRAPGRAVIVKAGDGAIDFKRGEVEKAALERVGLERGGEEGEPGRPPRPGPPRARSRPPPLSSPRPRGKLPWTRRRPRRTRPGTPGGIRREGLAAARSHHLLRPPPHPLPTP